MFSHRFPTLRRLHYACSDNGFIIHSNLIAILAINSLVYILVLMKQVHLDMTGWGFCWCFFWGGAFKWRQHLPFFLKIIPVLGTCQSPSLCVACSYLVCHQVSAHNSPFLHLLLLLIPAVSCLLCVTLGNVCVYACIHVCVCVCVKAEGGGC